MTVTDMRHIPKRKLIAASGLLLITLTLWLRLGPLPEELTSTENIAGYQFTARDGTPLSAAPQSTAGGRGAWLADQADKLAAATLAAEDRRYYLHPGVDPLAVLRALGADLRARRFAQGGSTITQQLVKMRTGKPARSIAQKLREMTLALRLEHRRGKKAILSDYLARAPYGGRVVGAEAAAQLYFNRPASQLTWAQAAFLAALPQRPTAFNPWLNPGAARNRQRYILGRLRDSGVISASLCKAALAEPLSPAGESRYELAPHYTEMLANELRRAGKTGGSYATSLDAPLQRDVEGIARHARSQLLHHGAANVAVVVLDNRSGAIRAWEGSGDYHDYDHGGMLNGPLLPRQTGSTIKPFIYALAFENGAAPGDLLDDSPLVIQWNGESFSPENYDHQHHGAVPMRLALGSSINVPAVRLLQREGPQRLAEKLAMLGLRPARPVSRYGLSLALGAAEFNLLSMTSAYATLARGGVSVPVKLLPDPAMPPVPVLARRVYSPGAAFFVTDILSDNAARTPAFGAESALYFPFPAAAKTGTSQNFHDNWAIGYTRDFTVGVWVGNFDREPLRGATGVTGAGPIFHAVMLAARRRLSPRAREDEPILAPPPEVELRAVCGMADGIPQHAADAVDAGGSACAAPHWEYQWRRAGEGGMILPAENRSTNTARRISPPPLQIVQPAPGAHYFIDPTLAPGYQKLPLRANHGLSPYRWRVDGQKVQGQKLPGVLAGDFFWLLQPGRHEACAVDGRGTESCANFRVD